MIPATAATRHLEPREPAVIGTCAGCGGDVAVNDSCYPVKGELIHADLTCALMALCDGDEPNAVLAGEWLEDGRS